MWFACFRPKSIEAQPALEHSAVPPQQAKYVPAKPSPLQLDHVSLEASGSPSIRPSAARQTQTFRREQAVARFSAAERELARTPWSLGDKLGPDHTIAPGDRARTLVTSWRSQPVYDAAANHAYAMRSATDIEAAAHALRTGEIRDFAALWLAARTSRLKSISPLDPSRDAFGRPREGMLTTAMQGRYAYIQPRLLQVVDTLLAKHNIAGGTHLERTAHVQERFGTDHIVDPQTSEVSAFMSNNGYGINLAPHHQFFQCFDAENKPNGGVLYNYGTSDSAFSSEFAKIHGAYSNALLQSDRERVLDAAFDGYRRSVSLAPDARGSAAKAHFALSSVLLARGIALPPAREGFAPDLEAMASTPTEWPSRARAIFGLDSPPEV